MMLLSQLLQNLKGIPKSLDVLFSSCENGPCQPPVQLLLEIMQEVINEFKHVYYVADALDECTQRSELLNLLAKIAGWDHQNLHLLMTSRLERDIESALVVFVDRENIMCLQIEIVDEDIKHYVRHGLVVDRSLAKWSKDDMIREEIERALLHGAYGM